MTGAIEASEAGDTKGSAGSRNPYSGFPPRHLFPVGFPPSLGSHIRAAPDLGAGGPVPPLLSQIRVSLKVKVIVSLTERATPAKSAWAKMLPPCAAPTVAVWQRQCRRRRRRRKQGQGRRPRGRSAAGWLPVDPPKPFGMGLHQLGALCRVATDENAKFDAGGQVTLLAVIRAAPPEAPRAAPLSSRQSSAPEPALRKSSQFGASDHPLCAARRKFRFRTERGAIQFLLKKERNGTLLDFWLVYSAAGRLSG